MKITLTKPMVRDGVLLDPGATLDLPDRQAEFFVQGGWATPSEQAAAAPDAGAIAPAKERRRRTSAEPIS